MAGCIDRPRVTLSLKTPIAFTKIMQEGDDREAIQMDAGEFLRRSNPKASMHRGYSCHGTERQRDIGAMIDERMFTNTVCAVRELSPKAVD
jgi:hypothetical protein